MNFLRKQILSFTISHTQFNDFDKKIVKYVGMDFVLNDNDPLKKINVPDNLRK